MGQVTCQKVNIDCVDPDRLDFLARCTVFELSAKLVDREVSLQKSSTLARATTPA